MITSHKPAPTSTQDQDISTDHEPPSLEQLESQLGASPDGLSQSDAAQRLEKYGPNELPEEKTNPVLKFLSYFWGPIPWLIEVAAVLSALVRHWADLFIILGLLIVNAVIGFWEEYQAGNTIAALKKSLALQAQVKRDGTWRSIPARELVPGDCVRLRIGDIVPADARLLDGDPIQVDQSALTGESLPVTRKGGDIVYSGSVIKQGEIDALVYATGANTYFAKTSRLAATAEGRSHFQKAVLKIGDFLIVLALVLVILILIVALFRGDDMLTTLEFALVLTVAAIPVAMPTVLSVTMAVGARLLAQKQAIVSRLASIEELAGVDILCSDKTGTLTQNKLTLGELVPLEGVDSNEILLCAALASRAEDQDPIDQAVINGLPNGEALKGYQITHFQPFDPVSKRTEATVKAQDGSTFRVSKGAPQVIMELVSGSESGSDPAQANALQPDSTQAKMESAVNDLARRGYRSLGVARSDDGVVWQFLGVIPLYDPPREDSKSTIETAEAMGVEVKMITGDQLAIGKEIARQVGLGDNILDARLFEEARAHEEGQLADTIEQADGFAQVFPEHKYHIVDVLQQRGHIVGMTGDGVNDAPALKKADAGIAVSGATDAARSAADIVLLAPGLSVIVDAFIESRKIFQRMNSYVIYRITETVRVLLFMTLSILVFNFYPVTAVMIVLLALLNDGAILTIAYDNVHYSRRPERWDMPLVLEISALLGFFGVIATFGLFYMGEQLFHLDRATMQSLMYLKLSVAGHLTIFVTRTRGPFWSIRPARVLVLAVLGTQLVATLIAVYGVFMTPIGWKWALFVWAYALAWFFINDIVKQVGYRLLDRQQPSWLTSKHTFFRTPTLDS
ncbi:MAG: plasma-membrane proton-efflux P-type ATPase [Caldilineaceae bacterium]